MVTSNTSLAGGLFYLLLGAVMLGVGVAVALDWHGWARRYTDLTDAMIPPTRRNETVDRWPRMLIQNRIIFGVTAAFGVMLLIGGIAGLAG